MTHPTSARLDVEHQPHPTEIDLQLVARIAVRHPDRDRPTPGMPAHLRRIALHRPLRDRHPPPGQQPMHLHRRQPLIQPRLHLHMISGQGPPRLTVTVNAMRTDRLEDRPQEPVIQLPLTTLTGQTQPDRGVDITPHGLAVDTPKPLDTADPLPP